MKPALKIRCAVSFLILLLASSLAIAESTFFDNSEDAFIMGNSPTGGVSGGTSGETAGGGGCRYEWNCTNWSECLPYGNQTRTCINIGTCTDTYDAPVIEQNCTYSIPKSTETGEKSAEENNSGIQKLNNLSEQKDRAEENFSESYVQKNYLLFEDGLIFSVISIVLMVSIVLYIFFTAKRRKKRV